MRSAIGYLHPGDVSAVFHFSHLRAAIYETGRTGVPPYAIQLRCASGQLVEGRNQLVESFLKTDAEWLWMVDADMGFGADTFERLVGDGTDPAVAALCFGVKRQGDDDPVTGSVRLRCFPTIYWFVERDDEAGFEVVTGYERDSRQSAGATGAACFVVRRDVLESVNTKYGTWFDQIAHPKGAKFSEDMSFWIRVAGCGFPLVIDTSVKTSHDKGGIFFDESVWDRQQASL